MRLGDVARRTILTAAMIAACWAWQPCAFAQENPTPSGQTPAETNHPDVIDILGSPTPPTAPTRPAVVFPEIKIPQFTSCSIAELQREVPELRKLKASEDQSHLTSLLDKIGVKVVEMARGTPNLVSDESVLSERNGVKSRQNFSFLTLHHATKLNTVVVDEFRVDRLSGEKFETDFLEDPAQSPEPAPSDLRALDLSSSKAPPAWGGAPQSQGFVSQWLNFYPANRPALEFRYLGEQTIQGRRELVVAFAQKPGIFPTPLIITGHDKAYKLYLQGVAWVDATDFRIVRLRSGVLSSPPEISLRQFIVEVDFGEAHVPTMDSPLWLPNRLVATTNVAGSTLRETHTYSNYRLFRAKSKLVLSP